MLSCQGQWNTYNVVENSFQDSWCQQWLRNRNCMVMISLSTFLLMRMVIKRTVDACWYHVQFPRPCIRICLFCLSTCKEKEWECTDNPCPGKHVVCVSIAGDNICEPQLWKQSYHNAHNNVIIAINVSKYNGSWFPKVKVPVCKIESPQDAFSPFDGLQ